MHQAIILQAQGVFIFPIAIAIALTARLRTPSPVAGTAANGRRKIALTGITHTQRTMTEHFDLHRRSLANIADLIPAQLPAEHHPFQTPSRQQPHTGQRMDRHLGRTVNGNMGRNGLTLLYNAQILHNKGIHTAKGSMANKLCQIGHFPIRNQCI